MTAVKKFAFDSAKLSLMERKILAKLTQAAELLAPLYSRQKNPRYAGAAFYPPHTTKKQISKAASRNKEVLNPYTFVERGEHGELKAIPYRVKFHKELTTIARLLREAAKLSDDKNFRAYLEVRARDLLRDQYDESNILWLRTDTSNIGCVVGPFDRYLDKLFFQKRAYMAWVGMLDHKLTKEMNRFKDAFLASERLYLPGSKRAKIPEVKVRVEDSVIFSGLVADFLFVGNNLPSSADIYLIKKYGTILTVFKPTTHWRFSQWIFPIFQSLFSTKIQQRYTKEELETAFMYTNVLHEASHAVMRYEDATSRLEELFPYFDELDADVLGIKGCGSLLLKGAITERDLETILLVTICHSLYFYKLLGEKPHLSPYAVGSAILLDFLLKGKALRKNKNGFLVDFQRMYMAISQLVHVLDYYMALGQKNEAGEFLNKFSVAKIFSHFESFLPH